MPDSTPESGATEVSGSTDTPSRPVTGATGKVTIAEHGGRLNVEQRLFGFLAFLWLSVLAQATLWTWLVVEPRDFEKISWPELALPQVAALVVMMGAVFAKLPSLRWPRRGSLVRLPSPIALTVLGLPSVLVLPLVLLRHRRAQNSEGTPEDVELAFRQLLVAPRTAGLSFLTWVAVAFAVDAVVLSERCGWATETVLGLAALWLALLAPYAVIVVSRARAMLRPEYLSAPRARNVSGRSAMDLRLRLTVPAIVGGLAAAAAPLLAGWIGSQSASRAEVVEAAREHAHELVRAAQEGDLESTGRFLADNPGVTLMRNGLVYGSPLENPNDANQPTGWIDRDGDMRPDAYVHVAAEATAIVPVAQASRMAKSLLLLAFVVLSLSVIAAIILITRDAARDVDRATAQVSAVAAGTVPPRLSEGSFSTRELRQLVQSVDRLVTRITESNVAKYVAIERAQEADRLKSQFLANMSHDLRSPLNSIIGFSELLNTGIDGQLTDDQGNMVGIMHTSGKELLQQIDDILDTAKIEAGRMELHPEPTPPATLLSRAIKNARRRQTKNIEYSTETAAGLPPAFVDPYRTVQAIENVLVFAAELMDEGEIRITARPGSTERSRMIFFEIETPRAPATAKQLTEVLRGFYRIPGHLGLGLGLPIAGSILELQGGTLGIEDDGEGMVFTLQCPAPEPRRQLRLRER